MKKIALACILMMTCIALQAQTKWDFTTTSESDVAHLAADTDN